MLLNGSQRAEWYAMQADGMTIATKNMLDSVSIIIRAKAD
jgi:hypothetical protein